MTWQTELKGVRKVDLACAVLMLPVTIWAGSIILTQETQVPAQETQVQETQVQETQVPGADDYKSVWEWCGGRFPYRDDLQEACRWGAYEMLPGQEAPADEGIQNVVDRS